MRTRSTPLRAPGLVALALLALPGAARAADAPHLADRGTGVATSMFGTYVRPGEWLVYPFFEYYRDHDYEYKPSELGFDYDQDLRGRYRASEGLLFVGYGIDDRFAIEAEAAVIRARLERAPDDPSSMPATLEESGLGDVQTLLTWRWLTERGARPELFSYAEVVFPFQKRKKLIGTQELEVKLGVGAIRGFGWGTVSLRVSGEHGEETELGTLAVEYLKRLSSAWGAYAGVEAAQDEVELITEAQWHVTDRAVVKLNNAFGVTSKATDWAPEVGVVFSFGGH
jgi:hypothetical protein